jgi:hypothetical protein
LWERIDQIDLDKSLQDCLISKKKVIRPINSIQRQTFGSDNDQNDNLNVMAIRNKGEI